MNNWLPIVISGLALAVSGVTAWLTLFRKGTVKMTQPTMIYFGPDGGPKHGAQMKVYLRTLLYSTSRRGQIVESMFVKLRRGESLQTFNFWTYGETQKIVRGSGVYVAWEGFAANHHFLPPPGDSGNFEFLPGDYTVTVFATLVGKKRPLKLSEVRVSLSEIHATAIAKDDSGIYFDWGPDSQKYVPFVQKGQRPLEKPEFLFLTPPQNEDGAKAG